MKYLSEKLNSIIKECEINGFRVLIEIEPSLTIYFWCDKENKRHIIRMVRKVGLTQNLNWNLTDEKTKYIKDYDLVYLEKNKGKIITRF